MNSYVKIDNIYIYIYIYIYLVIHIIIYKISINKYVSNVEINISENSR